MLVASLHRVHTATMNFLTAPVLRYVITAVTLFLVIDAVSTPAGLVTAVSETASYVASYTPTKGGRIQLQGVEGTWLISCRKASSLCEQVQRGALPDVAVTIATPSVWQGRWIVQASIAGHIVQAPAAQEEAYAASRRIQFALTAFFVLFAAVLWGLQAWRRRSA